jgi:hypothetical protein
MGKAAEVFVLNEALKETKNDRSEITVAVSTDLTPSCELMR